MLRNRFYLMFLKDKKHTAELSQQLEITPTTPAISDEHVSRIIRNTLVCWFNGCVLLFCQQH